MSGKGWLFHRTCSHFASDIHVASGTAGGGVAVDVCGRVAGAGHVGRRVGREERKMEIDWDTAG